MTTSAPKLETPDLTPEDTGKKKTPNRKKRYRLFDDDNGDYRIYQISSGASGIPAGTLVPIPDAGGFKNTQTAKGWLRDHGEKLHGMQVMIVRGLEIIRIAVASKPVVALEAKPRKPRTEPEPAAE